VFLCFCVFVFFCVHLQRVYLHTLNRCMKVFNRVRFQRPSSTHQSRQRWLCQDRSALATWGKRFGHDRTHAERAVRIAVLRTRILFEWWRGRTIIRWVEDPWACRTVVSCFTTIRTLAFFYLIDLQRVEKEATCKGCDFASPAIVSLLTTEGTLSLLTGVSDLLRASHCVGVFVFERGYV